MKKKGTKNGYDGINLTYQLEYWSCPSRGQQKLSRKMHMNACNDYCSFIPPLEFILTKKDSYGKLLVNILWKENRDFALVIDAGHLMIEVRRRQDFLFSFHDMKLS